MRLNGRKHGRLSFFSVYVQLICRVPRLMSPPSQLGFFDAGAALTHLMEDYVRFSHDPPLTTGCLWQLPFRVWYLQKLLVLTPPLG